MPYKRYAKRRTYRRRKTGGGAMSTAMKALSLATKVAGMLNTEYKFCDTAVTPTLTNTGYIRIVTDLAEGNDYNQRNGISLKMSSIQVRYNLIVNSASTTGVAVRAMWFIDHNVDGTTPLITDVLENTSTVSPLAHANTGRFTILYDKVHCLSSDGTEENSYRWFKKLNNHVKYSGPLVTDIRQGQVYMLWLTDLAALNPTCQQFTRIRYVDN